MSGSTENSVWPLPKWSFSVQGIPGDPVFEEVAGLEFEAPVVEYRTGSSAVFAPIRMPGLAKVGNVTLRKGIFVADTELWTWFRAIAMNSIARSTITVRLLDQAGAVRGTWTLHNAFPMKLTGTEKQSDGNEVAVESIEIVYETMTVALDPA
ncbi:MAG: phage tail protein [Paracraurococcus sp.]